MKLINMRIHYPEIYEDDHYEFVEDDIADELDRFLREEASEERKDRRHLIDLPYEALANLVQQGPSIEAVCEQRELFRALHKAIDKLPKAQGERVRKHYFKRMTFGEIANRERIGLDSAKKSVRRSIQLLRYMLGSYRREEK